MKERVYVKGVGVCYIDEEYCERSWGWPDNSQGSPRVVSLRVWSSTEAPGQYKVKHLFVEPPKPPSPHRARVPLFPDAVIEPEPLHFVPDWEPGGEWQKEDGLDVYTAWEECEIPLDPSEYCSMFLVIRKKVHSHDGYYWSSRVILGHDGQPGPFHKCETIEDALVANNVEAAHINYEPLRLVFPSC